jgi:hypothetical protein
MVQSTQIYNAKKRLTMITQKDLYIAKLELESRFDITKNELIKWVLGTGIGVVISSSWQGGAPEIRYYIFLHFHVHCGSG